MIINKLNEEKLANLAIFERGVYTISGLNFAAEIIRLETTGDEQFAVRFSRNDCVFPWEIYHGKGSVIREFGYQAARAISLDHGVSIEMVD